MSAKIPWELRYTQTDTDAETLTTATPLSPGGAFLYMFSLEQAH